MSNDPRDILRLKRCPSCDYDLTTLPRNYHCPECGFAYDESMFIVTGDAGHSATFSAEMAVYVALMSFFVLPVAAGRPTWGPALPLFLLAMGCIPFFGWLYRRWLGRSRGGDTNVLIPRDGLRRVGRRWARRSHPWDYFARVTVRRPRYFSVNPFAKRDRTSVDGISEWRIRLVLMWQWRVYTPGIDIRVRCSRREAMQLRRAFRARLRAAHHATDRR